ncbi:MAG: hypothetical protein ABH833_03010 [Parcubacteria group bacterium]
MKKRQIYLIIIILILFSLIFYYVIRDKSSEDAVLNFTERDYSKTTEADTITIEEAEIIQNKFVVEYMSKEPWSEYINGVGLSKVGLLDPHAPDDQSNDYAIGVLLEKQVPSFISLPLDYYGLNVYYDVVGKIRAL